MIPSPPEAGLALTFSADGLYALRAALAAHGARLGLDTPAVSRLQVVATELVTNVIRHSTGHGQLRLWPSGEFVYCQVIDTGPGLADPDGAGRQPVSLSAESGRGLWIVRQLTEYCTIDSGNQGTTVTVAFAR